MAEPYKREGSPFWWGQIYVNGKPKRFSLRTTSRPLARKRLRQEQDRIAALRWGDQQRRLFDDAAEKFVIEHLPNLKPSSAKRYIVSLKALGRSLSGIYIDQITSSKLLNFTNTRRQEGATPPTVRRDLSCLSSMFSHCVEAGWCDDNPVPPFLKRQKKRGLREAQPRTRYLSIQEEALLLEHATAPVMEAIALSIDTGVRRGELFALTWSQVDLQQGFIRLPRTSTKNHMDRSIPLLPRAAHFLAQYPRNLRSPYVFNNRNGKPFVHLHKGLKAAMRRAGIENLRWHDLRRTCGCRLLQEYRLSMEEVRDWLGHHSVVVTERSYAFLSIEKTKDRLDTMHKTATKLADNKVLKWEKG